MTLEHAEIREKLIATTLDLLDKGGLENVKARELAKGVGISVGSIYNLFGNVNGLLEAANSRIFSSLNALGEQALVQIEHNLAAAIASGALPDSAEAKVKFRLFGLAKAYLQFVQANEKRWAALLAFNRSRPAEEVSEWYIKQQEGLIEIVAHLLAPAPKLHDTEKRTLTARALWSATHGIVTMNYVSQNRPDAREWTWAQMEIMIDYFVTGLFAGE